MLLFCNKWSLPQRWICGLDGIDGCTSTIITVGHLFNPSSWNSVTNSKERKENGAPSIETQPNQRSLVTCQPAPILSLSSPPHFDFQVPSGICLVSIHSLLPFFSPTTNLLLLYSDKVPTGTSTTRHLRSHHHKRWNKPSVFFFTGTKQNPKKVNNKSPFLLQHLNGFPCKVHSCRSLAGLIDPVAFTIPVLFPITLPPRHSLSPTYNSRGGKTILATSYHLPPVLSCLLVCFIASVSVICLFCLFLPHFLTD